MVVRCGGPGIVVSFDGRTCALDFPEEGWRGTGLRRLIVPVTALAAVEHSAPKWLGRERVTLVGRSGADPFQGLGGRPALNPLSFELEEDGTQLASGLHWAIQGAGVAHIRALEYSVELVADPRALQFGDTEVRYDGTGVRIDGFFNARTIPLAALRAVRLVDDHLRFETGGDAGTVRCLGDRDLAAGVVLAARVLVDMKRSQRDHSSPVAGLPHGLQAVGGTLRLEGVGGAVEFDGAAVTVHAQRRTRHIPLSAVEYVDLQEAGQGFGHVRIRLAGASDDQAAYVPYLDVDTVMHRNDQAALEFVHRLTTALSKVVTTPDADLLATAGPRRDVAAALARASARARGMHRELSALSAVLLSAESVVELDLGFAGAEAGLLVLTDERLVFMSSARPVGNPYALSLTQGREIFAEWDSDHFGLFRMRLNDGSFEVKGLYNPARFRDAIYAQAAERTDPG